MTIQGKADKNFPFMDQTPIAGAGGHRALELGRWKRTISLLTLSFTSLDNVQWT